ncbi:arginine N-succinyltransferase [Nitrosomonas sp. ANs5]|uniref:arginine N-succinyltransferase n=1 Tax=Nitrosomonas sp. ANs5 TaxID=3423941 RepID=UPI003D33237F
MHWTHVLLIVLLTIVVTVAGTYWVLTTYIFVSSFKPVALNDKEEKTLQAKLHMLGYDAQSPSRIMNDQGNDEIDESGFLKPERYTEQGARREISFTEREMNALLAKNTELAQKLAIDLAEDLVSAKLLIPLDADFPVLGGKTLRFNAGIGMAFQNDKPVIILKGVSIMGIPIPNAWLGGLKNIDMVSEFGVDPGFWKSFAEGVDDIQVTEGKINIKLKE